MVVVEELDPFLETEIKAMGYKVQHGKDLIPTIGELSPNIVKQSLMKAVEGKRYQAPKVRGWKPLWKQQWSLNENSERAINAFRVANRGDAAMADALVHAVAH